MSIQEHWISNWRLKIWLQNSEFTCTICYFEFRILNSNVPFRILNSEFWIQMSHFEFWIQNSEFKCPISNFEFRILNSNVPFRILNSEFWIQNCPLILCIFKQYILGLRNFNWLIDKGLIDSNIEYLGNRLNLWEWESLEWLDLASTWNASNG